MRFIVAHPEARARAVRCVQDAPAGYVVEVREPTRNLEQNSLLWVWLTAFSEQLEWPVNGKMTRLTPDEWKQVLTSAYRREMRVAQGIDGGMVLLGASTSRMGRREFAELIELIQSVAADRGVSLDREK